MSVLKTNLDPKSDSFAANEKAMQAQVDDLQALLARIE